MHEFYKKTGGYSPENIRLSHAPGSGGRQPQLVRQGRLKSRLSFAQERLWFLEQMDPGNAAYNIFVGMRLLGRLDEDALQRAVTEIIRRHEILRTHFDMTDGEPIQIVDSPPEVSLIVEDLRGVEPGGRERALQRRAEEEANMPFDLTRSPLLRARLLVLGEDDYALFLAMHHIISDGWSIRVLMRELSAIYDAYTEGRPSPLPNLPVQYSDYALWQHDSLQDSAIQKDLRYWREQLKDLSSLALPTDRPRPPVRTYRGATEAFTVEKKISDKLHVIAQKDGATLFMALAAAFQIVLGRWTGQQDIAIGTGIASRNCGELEHLIGMFVNTLVLRTDLSGTPSFRELLARVRRTAIDAYAHQSLPFERLVEELSPERDLSRSPIFDVLFGLNRLQGQELALPGIITNQLSLPLSRSKFDLTLVFNERDGQINGALTYSTDLFEAETIRRMIGHIQHALGRAVEDPESRIGDWDLLNVEERNRLLLEWNHTSSAYPQNLCAHELFEDQARKTPEATAVICQDGLLTYAELNKKADMLAARLIQLGVGLEDRVAICLQRGTGVAIGLLAVLKAGGVYVPMDPEYPAERLRWMLQDAKAALVLTQQSLRERIPRTAAPLLCIEDLPAVADESVSASLPRKVSPENLAYVIYTSGSTGHPKGVMVQHQSLVNTLTHSLRAFAFAEDDVWAGLASFSFDISLLETMTPWLAGAASLIFTREEVLDIDQFAARLEQATSFLAVPSLMRHIVAHMSGRPTPRPYPRLRRVFTGGERVSPDLIRDTRDVFPDAEIIVLYGPTEATLICAGEQVNSTNAGKPLIGRPIANTQIYILDNHMRPVVSGTRGELYIGGDGLARGYLNRPDLTAQLFVPDPFTSGHGRRLYRTGDLGRYGLDGSIEFLGRVDEQIKIRGHRIEPAETDAALAECGGVQASVTIARESVDEELQLVSYVVPQSGAEIWQIWESLRKRLPAYMIPSAIVPINSIPMTSNGKLDRGALPVPSAESSRATCVVAETPLEQRIAAIWSKVLGVQQVGAEDSFFELGGHSLSLARLRDALNHEFESNLSMVEMFKFPTVRAMARRIDGRAITSQAEPDAYAREQLSSARDRMARLQRRRSNSMEA